MQTRISGRVFWVDRIHTPRSTRIRLLFKRKHIHLRLYKFIRSLSSLTNSLLSSMAVVSCHSRRRTNRRMDTNRSSIVVSVCNTIYEDVCILLILVSALPEEAVRQQLRVCLLRRRTGD